MSNLFGKFGVIVKGGKKFLTIIIFFVVVITVALICLTVANNYLLATTTAISVDTSVDTMKGNTFAVSETATPKIVNSVVHVMIIGISAILLIALVALLVYCLVEGMRLWGQYENVRNNNEGE